MDLDRCYLPPVRPHVHPRAVIAATLLVVGLAVAVVGPRFVRGKSPAGQGADEDRSDRKPWNNDASLQFRD
jgi:hypothetical protein